MLARRAAASSSVRSLRRSSPSGRGPPGPKRGSNFWNCTSVAPKLWKLRTMLLLKPVTIETIAMTVATPTTIPSTVRNARSLCARTARKANRTFSPKPRRRWEKRLLIPQRLDRRQAARLRGRNPAGKKPGHRRHADADQNEGGLHLRGKDLVDGKRDEPTQGDADRAAHRRKQRGLEQELPPDVAPPGSQGAPHADLLGPLDDRHEHDVGDHDGSHDERNAGDQDHQ